MSDGKIVHDWIDTDKLRKTAEDLLKPAPAKSLEEKEAATYGDDFVGFAEPNAPLPKPKTTPAPSAVSAPPKPVAPVPVPQASTVAKVTLPPVKTPATPSSTSEPENGGALPVVKPAALPKPKSAKPLASNPASKLSIQTPFKIVTEKISAEEFAKLPRSV